MLPLRQVIFKKQFLRINSARILKKFSATCVDDNVIFKTPFSDIDIPNTTIHELFYSKIEPYYKYTACECAETGRSYTYEQLRVKARNFSKALRKILKLNEKETVAILLPNIPEFAIVSFGILEAGLIVTTINPMYTPAEIARQLMDTSAKAIITLVDLFITANAALSLNKQKLPIITIKHKMDQSLPFGAINFDELINAKIDIPDFQLGNKNDLAALLYSSGSTGLPKGVEITHYGLVSNILQNNHPEVICLFPPTETFQDILPAVLPMFHVFGFLIIMINGMINGAKIITLNKFTPKLFTSVLINHHVTVLNVVPPLVLFLSSNPDVKAEYFQNVREVICGAAPLSALEEDIFMKKAGSHIKLSQGYGLTETGALVYTSKMQKETFNLSGSVGSLLPNTSGKIVAIDNPTAKPLGPNQVGEILVKGPQVFKGYLNKPEETKEAFLDGWFRTGDTGYYDENGFLYISDRLKELIKVKGYQVAPAELEGILRSHPSIEDAAVIGISHLNFGEVPRAYVVLKGGKRLKAKEVHEFVSQKVAPFKQLQGGVEFIDVIPRNAGGKILRKELQIRYKELS